MAHPVVLYHPLFWWVRWLFVHLRMQRMHLSDRAECAALWNPFISRTSKDTSTLCMQALYTGFTVLTQIDKSNSKQPSTNSL